MAPYLTGDLARETPMLVSNAVWLTATCADELSPSGRRALTRLRGGPVTAPSARLWSAV